MEPLGTRLVSPPVIHSPFQAEVAAPAKVVPLDTVDFTLAAEPPRVRKRSLALMAAAGLGIALAVSGVAFPQSPVGSAVTTTAKTVARGPDVARLASALAKDSCDVYRAPSPSSQTGFEDGQLQTMTWNLHGGYGVDGEPQLPQMIEALKDADADVYTLQEVKTRDVQTIVDALGMDGYYAQTNLSQGDLILLHPGVRVLDNARHYVNQDDVAGHPLQAFEGALAYVHEGASKDPREVQVLRIQMPGGQTALVANTHLMNKDFHPDERREQVGELINFVNGMARPGEAVIGGGDFNLQDDHAGIQDMRDAGFDMHGTPLGYGVDYLFERNMEGQLETSSSVVRDAAGNALSDHPAEIGTLNLA